MNFSIMYTYNEQKKEREKEKEREKRQRCIYQNTLSAMREVKEVIHLKAYSTISRGQPHHIAQHKLFLTWSENYTAVHGLIRCLFEVRTEVQQDNSLFISIFYIRADLDFSSRRSPQLD